MSSRQDDEPGDEEGHGVDPDRDDDRVEVQPGHEVVERARHQRHAGVDDGGERRRAVGGDEADLVRHLEPLGGTRLGMVASLAGIQKSATHSMRTVAM
jgi:hypothetical protein